MADRIKKGSVQLISQRLAVVAIAILFGASTAGWICTELMPPDFLDRKGAYAERWGSSMVRLVDLLRLYDPFHSFWYRMVLALFFIVLALCIITRWRQFILRSFRLDPPIGIDELRKKEFSFEFSWRVLKAGERKARDLLVVYGERYGKKEAIDREALREAFSKILSIFRRKKFRVAGVEGEGAFSFVASAGRWRSVGNFLFHVGILAVTVGGVVGSFRGWKELVYVKEGETVPLPPDSVLRLRVEDFDMVMTDRMEVKDYISTVSILDRNGNTVETGSIEVNRPMKVDGRRIYQSSYYVDETTFKYARVAYVLENGIRRGTIDLTPSAASRIEGTSVMLSAGRFFPDFRMGPGGPFSASSFPANPALEVEVKNGEDIERGFLFLYHPGFNKKFGAPVHLTLVHCEPIFYTGLEVSSSPAAPILFLGFAIATVGIGLMYLSNPRTIKGIVGRETLVVAGTDYRWKASFEKEFKGIGAEIRNLFAASKE